MKTIEKIKEEIGGKFLDFSELDKYMVQAGYHSNLADVDLVALGKDASIIYLGKEEEGMAKLDLIVTRWSPFPDTFNMIIKDVLDE